MRLNGNVLPKEYKILQNSDLTFYNETQRVTAYNSQGKRESQEDCMTIIEVPGFNQLTSSDQKAVLLHTYDAINNRLKLEAQSEGISANNSGTTALTCFSYVAKDENKTIINIVSANLADSSAYYFIRNKSTGKIRSCARINKNLHKSNDPKEIARVKQAGGFVSNGRLNSRLAVARVFGDFTFGNTVSHKPDIDQLLLDLHQNEELLLIAASDGLTENNLKNGRATEFTSESGKTEKIKGSEIAALNDFIENDCAKLDFTKLAEALTNWAINTNYSEDNVSVIVQSIDADLQKPTQRHPVMLAIFDGHGGINVARFVKDIFSGILNQQIRKYWKPGSNEKNTDLLVPLLSNNTDVLNDVNSQKAKSESMPETISKIQPESVGDNMWLTEEVLFKIKNDYAKKLNSKLIKKTSVESQQLLNDLNKKESLEASQQIINIYLANEEYKDKRLYGVLIKNRVCARIDFVAKNSQHKANLSSSEEFTWLSNSTIDDICFLIYKRYTQARGFKFFGYTSGETFAILESLRKPSTSDDDRNMKQRILLEYIAKVRDTTTRLHKIINTILYDEIRITYNKVSKSLSL